jgi:hypothetical protein
MIFAKPVSYELKQSPDGSRHKFRLEFRSTYEKTNWSSSMDGYTYRFNGRTYQDVESLWKEPSEDLTQNVQIVTDIYGEKVLKTYTQVPTFDSGDREWDSKRLEFLFFDGKNIHLVLMAGGYRIAKLSFYETLVAADVRMKPIFEKLGWKLPNLKWID